MQSLSTEVASPFLQDPEPLQCGHRSSLASRSINEQKCKHGASPYLGRDSPPKASNTPRSCPLSAADISAKLSSFHGFENFQCCGGKGLLPQSAKNLGCHMSWFQIRPFKGWNQCRRRSSCCGQHAAFTNVWCWTSSFATYPSMLNSNSNALQKWDVQRHAASVSASRKQYRYKIKYIIAWCVQKNSQAQYGNFQPRGSRGQLRSMSPVLSGKPSGDTIFGSKMVKASPQRQLPESSPHHCRWGPTWAKLLVFPEKNLRPPTWWPASVHGFPSSGAWYILVSVQREL